MYTHLTDNEFLKVIDGQPLSHDYYIEVCRRLHASCLQREKDYEDQLACLAADSEMLQENFKGGELKVLNYLSGFLKKLDSTVNKSCIYKWIKDYEKLNNL